MMKDYTVGKMNEYLSLVASSFPGFDYWSAVGSQTGFIIYTFEYKDDRTLFHLGDDKKTLNYKLKLLGITL